jgi:hypothetical protein
VDVVARSVALLATASIDRPGYIEYPIANPHRDVSLDGIVDCVRSAGYRVEVMDDYAVWYQDFKGRLNSLDRATRHLSLLPLLHMWERPRQAARIHPDTSCVERHLAQASAAAGRAAASPFPRITEAFIHKVLSDMRALELIDEAVGIPELTP